GTIMFTIGCRQLVPGVLRSAVGALAVVFGEDAIAQLRPTTPITPRSIVPTTPPLEITNLRFNPGVTTVRVTWSTNRPASSRVDYGQPPSYELGFVEDPALVLSHTITLFGLDPDTLYDFMSSSVDGGGFAADSGNQQVETKVADPCGVVSDDFDQPN